MQTLGLSSESKRTDGWLKSIFWPTVENAWDVDYLGRQGLTLCLIIAAVELGFSILGSGGNLFLLGMGLLGAAFYFAGGMGVREKSWAAAAMVFAVSVLEALMAVATGALLSPVGALRILLAALLFSNLRATFLASEQKAPAEGEDRPERLSETFGDKLTDTLPPKLWPVVRIPFFAVGGLWCVLGVLGLLWFALLRLGLGAAQGAH